MTPINTGGQWILPIALPHLKYWCSEHYSGQRVSVAVVSHPRDTKPGLHVMYFGWIFKVNGSSVRGHANTSPIGIGWDRTENAHAPTITERPDRNAAGRDWDKLQAAVNGANAWP